MAKTQARVLLGVSEAASREEIIDAHRRFFGAHDIANGFEGGIRPAKQHHVVVFQGADPLEFR
jgi:hypothetical protein